jgi:hypothetical protein
MVSGASTYDAHIPQPTLEKLRLAIRETFDNSNRGVVSMSKVLLNPPRSSVTGYRVWILTRQPMNRQDWKQNTVNLDFDKDPLIWDNRILVRAKSGADFFQDSPLPVKLEIRPFQQSDYPKVLQKLKDGSSASPEYALYSKTLQYFWSTTPPLSKSVIPCIVANSDLGSEVIALPTLGINLEAKKVQVEAEYILSKPIDRVDLYEFLNERHLCKSENS